MRKIEIEIKNKIARSPEAEIVCGNSDYEIHFSFDEEWSEYNVKTARFKYNGKKEDIVFEGNVCNAPIIKGASFCTVGVYAGDLHTTTPALIVCKKSILCDDGLPADPTPDVYAQLMEKLNKITGLDDEVVARALAAYLAENPLEELDPTVPEWAKQQNKPSYTAQEVGALSAEALPAAVNEALAQAKASGAFDGADGKDGQNGADGYSPVKGEDYFTPEEVQEIAEQAAEMVEVPETLPNPNALTFTGAVEGSYDGSEPLSIEIPQGGGESKKWVHIAQIEITEDINEIFITEDVDGKPFEVENIHAFIKAVQRTDDVSALRVAKILRYSDGDVDLYSTLTYGLIVQVNTFGNKTRDIYGYYESVVTGNYRKLNVVESYGAFSSIVNPAAPNIYQDGTTIGSIKENATTDSIYLHATNGFKVGDTIDIWGI